MTPARILFTDETSVFLGGKEVAPNSLQQQRSVPGFMTELK